MDPAALFALSTIVGLAVGLLSGLLGIGGGTLLVPIFKLGYAMDAIACTATSLFTIVPTSLSGAITHVRNKTCVPKLGVVAGIGGMATSPVGVWLASLSPSWAIMAAAAAVIFYSAYTMFRKALAAPKSDMPKPTKDRARAKAKADDEDGEMAQVDGNGDANNGVKARMKDDSLTAMAPHFELQRAHLTQGFGIGLLAGLLSGYVGVGGGFIIVPLMMKLMDMPMKLTSGTSLIAVLLLAIPGVVMQGLLGNVNWLPGIAVAVGSIPGALLGARITPHVPERMLRFLFSGFLVVAGAMLAINELGLA